MASPTLTANDLTIRSTNDPAGKHACNTWAELEDLDTEIQFRVDADMWFVLSETMKVRVAVAAYNDLLKMPWTRVGALNQSRDYGFSEIFGDPILPDPPLYDIDFQWRIKRAQAAQIMFILAGTQVRDMAREGIGKMAAISADLQFSGYRGACSGEVWELLGPFVDRNPRLARIRR